MSRLHTLAGLSWRIIVVALGYLIGLIGAGLDGRGHCRYACGMRLKYLQRATWGVLVAALAFWAFFQLSKRPQFSSVNPFADDPIDAIGSIAFQVAVVCALLNLARLARAMRDPDLHLNRALLILRGGGVTLGVIAITLAADVSAELQQPTWGVSIWGALLAAGLVVIALLVVVAAFYLAAAAGEFQVARRSQPYAPAEAPGSLADTLEDLWLLAWVPITWLRRRVTWIDRTVAWAEQFTARYAVPLVARLSWVDPRFHPWRLCLLVALVAGIGLAAAHGILEGPAPNLRLAILASSIFIGFETAAVLLSYLVFGGFLGLRPPLRLR